MRVTIIPIDNSVRKDELFLSNLDLSSCGIPEVVHALQFNNGSGWIEYESGLVQNEPITSLPIWAQNCIDALNAKIAENEAYQASLPVGIPISQGD